MTVHCKDTRIVVNVGTNRPFSGRIYALGRSETCNVDVISSDSFRLDLTMAGQDCNTQSVVSSKVVTKKGYNQYFMNQILKSITLCDSIMNIFSERNLHQYRRRSETQCCHD